MNRELYLFDTHALIFWSTREAVAECFLNRLDELVDTGNTMVSSISFWETAFLVKRKRIAIGDIDKWRTQLLDSTNLSLIDPTASEMIDSVRLPDHHSDPFDRILVVQALRRGATLISRDRLLRQYQVPLLWE